MSEACADALTPGSGDPSKLCPGTPAVMAWDALIACACTGKCMASCSADNFCTKKQSPPGNACENCLTDVDMGCGTEVIFCANN
jgi:hypothetical protein